MPPTKSVPDTTDSRHFTTHVSASNRVCIRAFRLNPCAFAYRYTSRMQFSGLLPVAPRHASSHRDRITPSAVARDSVSVRRDTRTIRARLRFVTRNRITRSGASCVIIPHIVPSSSFFVFEVQNLMRTSARLEVLRVLWPQRRPETLYTRWDG